MALKSSYRVLAPFYDAAIARLLDDARRRSIASIPRDGHLDILIAGVGTGLDLPLLPQVHRYVGVDLVRAMLERARPRTGHLDCTLVCADSMLLPFAPECFDWVILHLIVAVVPHPAVALGEAARVTRPGGKLLVLDKFLAPGARAPLRRLLSPLTAQIATRLDVVFEETLAAVEGLRTVSDRPVAASGWFRSIVLEKASRSPDAAA